MAVRKTHNQFEKEFYAIHPNAKLIGEYINNRSKIKWVCENGHNCESKAGGLLRGYGCIKCSGRKKLTHDEFEKEFYKFHPGATLIGKYVNTNTKIKWVCENGHTRESKPHKLKTGECCRKCYLSEATRSHDEFEKEFYSIHPNAKLTGVYKQANSKVNWICEKGHKCKTRANSLLHGHGCNICSNEYLNKFTLLYFLEFTNHKTNNVFQKIGVTTVSIQDRFKKLPRHISYIICHTESGSYHSMVSKEQHILHTFAEKSFCATELRGNVNGSSECFTGLTMEELERTLSEEISLMSINEIYSVRYHK